MGRDPVADLGGAVAGARQALPQESEQRRRVAALEAADAIPVESLVDPAHVRLTDRVAQSAGGEDRHAELPGIARNRVRQHRAPVEAARDRRIRRLEIVEHHRDDRGERLEPGLPQRNAESVIEREPVGNGRLEAVLERFPHDVPGKRRVPG